MLGKLRESSDGLVLFVVLLRDNHLVGGAYRGEHIGLSVGITVSSDSQVDLALVGITLESLGNTCTRPSPPEVFFCPREGGGGLVSLSLFGCMGLIP